MKNADRVYSKEEVMEVMEPLVSTWFNNRFQSLTIPQSKAIPIIHERKNVLVSSPTGSGKTLTAFLSIINELTRYANGGALEDRVYCIYISPLKALANDVNRNLNSPLDEMKEVAKENGMNIPNIRVGVRSGDTTPYERQKMLKKPPHILITTPESLALVLEAPKFKERLEKVEWVILDEIHDICDSKRGAFLSLTLERLKEHCQNEFVRIGLSATLAPIEAIAGFLVGSERDGTRDVTLVESGTRKQLDLKVLCPTDDMTALSSEIVNSKMYDQLKELIDEHETTLVFTNTRSGAESVVYKLKERGLENIEVHHSSLGKETRLDVEERLKRGEIKCVVSSTSLELGIDIGSVDLVCQIGSPKSVAKGLQRIGRSGHSMGKTAKGRLLVFDQDDLVECAVMCRAAHRGDIDRVGIPENCLDVLAQALVGMSLDKRWDVDEAYDLVRGSYCYRNLPKSKFVSVLRYLGSKDEFEGVYSKLWYDDEEEKFGRKKGSRMIYFMNIGTIPEEANYRVLTSHGSSVGELSEKFVERLSPRDIFVLGGRSFEFVRTKGMSAYVKEASGRKPTVPSWAGEMLPRSFDLSMEVAKFRGELAGRTDESEITLIPKLSEEFDIDAGSARSLISYFREQKVTTGIIPDNKMLAVEEYIDPSGNHRLVFHFPFGRRVNDALSRGYAYRLSNLIGCNVSVTMSDDSFMIGASRHMDASKISTMLSSKDLEGILKKAIRDSEVFKMRFRHTAARSFMILRNYMGRSMSVNRQQIRSSYLLETLGNIEDMPVVEETYREVLEDDMDIKNARVILDMLESGEMSITVIPFSGTPSPFAHSAILSGFSDIVLMEDRSALLKELHRKVLHRAIGDIKEYEFDEDVVIPYFREKIGRIATKDEIVPFLMKMGPLQAFRERGRNIYAYSDADKKTMDAWCRELLREEKIGTVFLDDPHIMASEEIGYYASATRKERELNDADNKVLDAVTKDMTADSIAKASGMDEDSVFRSLRKLESMYLITRSDVVRGKWSFSKFDRELPNKDRSLDTIIMRHMECFAPATVHEVAFSLSIPENEAKMTLDALTEAGKLSCGRFLISENDQYMKKADRMRLKAGSENVFTYEAAERYRRSKGLKFRSTEDFFKFYGSAGSILDVFNRVENFSMEEWSSMRESGKLLLGRFVRGKVRYVLAEDGERYAFIRNEPLLPIDEIVLARISAAGKITTRQLVQEMNLEKDEIKESVNRLDRALKILRAYDEREDWGSENTYEAYNPNTPGGDALRNLAASTIRAFGPMPTTGLRFILGVSQEETQAVAKEIGASTISVGEGHVGMFIMPEEIEKIDALKYVPENIRILSLSDPALVSKWAEISSRYGDKWVYPIVKEDMIVGALEIWEMSGCVEIRSMDMENPNQLQEVLNAVDDLMKFFRMKGQTIVRIREILNVDAADLSEDHKSILKSSGYSFINGFYAKGDFVPKTFTDDEILSYVFHKQRIAKSDRYPNIMSAIDDRGYIRGDAEALIRVNDRKAMKKMPGHEYLMQMTLVPGFLGFTTPKFAHVYMSARSAEIDKDMKVIMNMLAISKSASRKYILENSPLSAESALNALHNLSHASIIYMNDSSREYSLVRPGDLTRNEALKEIFRLHFRSFGMFSAEQLYGFIGFIRMAEIRRILAELEEEGFIVKGFFRENDPTVMWMLKNGVEEKIEPFTEMFLLNTQDNLHTYLRPMIRDECGGSENAIFSGTGIIGSFKGKLTAAGAKIEDFKGSDEALAFIKELAKSLGVSTESRRKDEDKDWDVCEFYLKTHPGSVSK